MNKLNENDDNFSLADETEQLRTAMRSLEQLDYSQRVLINAYKGVTYMQALCYALSSRSGWWKRPDGRPIDPFNSETYGMKIALIHSEVTEALEGDRRDAMDKHLPHRRMDEVELADAVIRIFDLADARRMDLAGAIIEKLAYNQARADHQLSNRAQPGGKAY
jgi:hypothetical protein